jgi:hypothetical protein
VVVEEDNLVHFIRNTVVVVVALVLQVQLPPILTFLPVVVLVVPVEQEQHHLYQDQQ